MIENGTEELSNSMFLKCHNYFFSDFPKFIQRGVAIAFSNLGLRSCEIASGGGVSIQFL